MKFPLTILTPAGPAFKGDADAISITATDGSMGVLANHAPMIAAVTEGAGKITVNGKDTWYALGEGTLEVRPPQVLLLIDYAEAADSKADAVARAATTD